MGLRVDSAQHRDAVDSQENLRRFRFMQAKLIGFIRSEGQGLARYPRRDTSQPARYARAIAYYRQAKLDRARAELDALIGEDPHNPYFQELMRQILFENGRAAESIPYHRRSIEYAPGQPLLQVNLARALVAANGRAGTDEAIRLLNEAVRKEPDNGFAWREMASAYNERGEEPMAELASADTSCLACLATAHDARPASAGAHRPALIASSPHKRSRHALRGPDRATRGIPPGRLAASGRAAFQHHV